MWSMNPSCWASGIGSSPPGTNHGEMSRINSTARDPRSATPTIGLSISGGRACSRPRFQHSTGAVAGTSAIRIVQSTAGSRYFTTYGAPSMVTRSRAAPDLPTLSIAVSSPAPARSSSTDVSTGCGSSIGSLHLGHQPSRPPAAAEHRVGHDPVIGDLEDVQVVGGVRDAVLAPSQQVVDHLPAR